MSRPSYAKALDKLLTPLGFHREGTDWIRIRGDMWECVNLQTSSIAGVTVNVAMKDLETERIVSAIPCDEPLGTGEIIIRLGQLIDHHDRWWKSDPDGPADMAAAVETYGLPWFDSARTPEQQLAQWYGGGNLKPWRGSCAAAAATLYRLGRLHNALAWFDAPVPKTAIPAAVLEWRCVQRWLATQLERP